MVGRFPTWASCSCDTVGDHGMEGVAPKTISTCPKVVDITRLLFIGCSFDISWGGTRLEVCRFVE